MRRGRVWRRREERKKTSYEDEKTRLQEKAESNNGEGRGEEERMLQEERI